MDSTDVNTLEGYIRSTASRIEASLQDPTDKVLKSSVHNVLNEMGKAHAPIRPDILRVMNTFSSLRDELGQGLTTKAEAKAEAAEALRAFKVKVKAYITSNLDSVNAADQGAADISRQMIGYSLIKHEIESAIQSNKLWVGKAPIIPQLQQNKNPQVRRTGGPAQPFDALNALSAPLLHKMGVPCTTLGGYTVLTKELVLVVPRGYMKSQMANPDIKPEDWAPKHDKEAESLYSEITDSVLAKWPRHEVMEVTSAWKGSRCYWLATSGELAILRKSAGGSMAIQRWSFAFGN